VSLLGELVQLYVIVLFARIILSWFPMSGDSPLAPIYRFLFAITEPLLAPIRRVIPPIGLGGMGLDLSPLIVLLVLEFLRGQLH
jgi:YggT family protein